MVRTDGGVLQLQIFSYFYVIQVINVLIENKRDIKFITNS